MDKTQLSVWGGPGPDSRISPAPRSRIVQENIAIEPVVLPNKPLLTDVLLTDVVAAEASA